jgi:hypothetical protein
MLPRPSLAALVLLVLVPLPVAAGGARAQDRVDGWTADLDQWLGTVQREHYVYREGKELPEALFARADWLREHIPELSDQRILLELGRLAALLGDGHTTVRPFASRFETTALPLRFYFFSDGLFVIDALPGFERWIGSQVLAIGATAPEVLLARLADYVSRDNAEGTRWTGPTLLRLTGTLEAVAEGLEPAKIPVTLRAPGAEPTVVVFTPAHEEPSPGTPKLVPSRLQGAPPPPLYLEDVARAHWFRALDERTLYVQFNQVVNAPGETLAEFAAHLASALAEHSPARLLLDVRHNNGGDGSLLPPLMRTLRDFERRPEAEIVVLMGRNTFSAAQIFLAQVDRDTRALFAGEPSSSRPNFVGEENSFRLPWSGASGSISNRYHETIPGDTREFIAPDIAFELSSADYFANRDPLLDLVLARPTGGRAR